MINPNTITPLAQQLKARLLAHEAKIGIIGLGYVGLPLALLYSGAGFRVTGFDIDDNKVDALKEGKSYIYRIPAEEIQEARANGLMATSDFSNLADMDAIIICVPTPLNDFQEPDTSFIVFSVFISPSSTEGHTLCAVVSPPAKRGTS